MAAKKAKREAAPRKSKAKKRAVRKPRASGGAPTKRTKAAREKIFAALREQGRLNAAAAAAGMSYQTLNEWRKDDTEFSDACEHAREEHARFLYMLLRAQMPDSPESIRWALERLFPKDFARPDVLLRRGGESEDDPGVAVVFKLSDQGVS